MSLTIIAIAAFQLYWLKKAYDREERNLEMRTNILFRETVRGLQASKLRLDRAGDTSKSTRIVLREEKQPLKVRMTDPKMTSLLDVMLERIGDTSKGRVVVREIAGMDSMIHIRKNMDSVRVFNKNLSGSRDRLIQFLYDMDSMQDSIRVKELKQVYTQRLDDQNIPVPFEIFRVPTRRTKQTVYNEVTLGFQDPVTYRLELSATNGFLLRRISVPILFSFFLVGFTILSFSLLYRNLQRQRKLGDIKNEFISNITHELKTPIATVSVAIEALRSFNATMDPAKTKEYLDISANELQRLSMLVDKVLKLSMFEKKEIDLKYESLDMKELVSEVTTSMRLQFEKHHADVQVETDGDTTLEGDRLHLVSVIFNLIDNALKYSSENPKIRIAISSTASRLQMTITDSGIGISPEYHNKIFEKFFRVPTGNLHNAKGYGLGLSYVAHVIRRHQGSIRVESVEGNGSRFIIQLPKLPA
jgi:two-component system phosphate regulon sensor histidine kinase PhoR